jgi:hypothetical protein
MWTLRRLARTVGGLILIGLSSLGVLLWIEAPLPQSIIDWEAKTGLTKRGRFLSYGYAIIPDSIPLTGLWYYRYNPKTDHYLIGLQGHFDQLPRGSVINVKAYISGDVLSCVNGLSVLFDRPNLLTPATAKEIASDRSITENHAADTCTIIVPKWMRDLQTP